MWQASYNSADVPFRTLKSMSKRIVSSVLPDAKVNRISLHEGMHIILVYDIFRYILIYLDIFRYI